MYKDRKAVSPVVGVILMVAATIVIAAIVMGFLGGFKAPQKPLDIQIQNVELKFNTTSNTTYLTFTVVGSDAEALYYPDAVRQDLKITFIIGDNAQMYDLRDNDIDVNANGGYISITFNQNVTFGNERLAFAISQIHGHKVRVIIKYDPTGQLLFDGILIAKSE